MRSYFLNIFTCRNKEYSKFQLPGHPSENGFPRSISTCFNCRCKWYCLCKDNLKLPHVGGIKGRREKSLVKHQLPPDKRASLRDSKLP